MKSRVLHLLVVLAVIFCCCCVVITKDNEDHLDVYLVPHSHWDVGWLETIRSYYEGQVKSIIDNVLTLLENHPKRRFVFAEVAFMERWWNDASDDQKKLFLRLLQSKQIEFVLGGWTMPDEALNTYYAIINTMSRGLQWIKDTFGEQYIPRTAWRIDPFGSNTAVSKLYKDMGFSSAVVMRLPHTIQSTLRNQKQLEFLYRLKDDSSLFTTVMDVQYCVNDFFFGQSFTSSRLEVRADMLNNEIIYRARGYKSGSVLFPLGCDFTWSSYHNELYRLLEETIEYMNQNPEKYAKTLKFALVSDYMNAVNPRGDGTASTATYNGDLMPYSDGDQAYWTGYFTSRPSLKRDIRYGESVLKMVNTFYTLAYQEHLNDNSLFQELIKSYDGIQKLLTAAADSTHHDGITGTARSYVVSDYTSSLFTGIDQALSSTLAPSLKLLVGMPNTTVMQCNPRRSVPADDDLHALIITNPLSWNRTGEVVQIAYVPSSNDNTLCIYSQDNQQLDSYYNDKLNTVQFVADVPALGYSTYFAKKCPKKQRTVPTSRSISEDEDSYLENRFIKVHFCKEDNRTSLCKIFNKQTDRIIDIEQGIYEYSSKAQWGVQNSGAYIFVPEFTGQPQPDPVHGEYSEQINKTSPLFEEFVQTFSSYATQRIILYRNADYIEIQTTVGSLPNGKELVTRFNTSIKNNKVLYADKNGLEMRKWEFKTDNLPQFQIAKNYLPMVHSSYIQDEKDRLSLISTQSFGVSSLEQGSVEIMLHRSCLADDGRGLGEAMIDRSIYTSVLRLKVENTVNAPEPTIFNQKLIQETNNPLHVSRVATKLSVQDYLKTYRSTYSPLNHVKLPDQIHVLSLETVFNRHLKESSESKVIVRLQHLGETDKEVSNVNIEELVTQFKFTTLQETSLATQDVLRQVTSKDLRSIQLKSNQIRTFVANHKANSPPTPVPSTSPETPPEVKGSRVLFMFTAFVTVVVMAVVIAAGMFILQSKKGPPPGSVQLTDEFDRELDDDEFISQDSEGSHRL